MGEVALRVHSAQRERIIPPLVQSVHNGYRGPITGARNLLPHPLVVVPVRITKQIDLTSEDFFETRLRIPQLPTQTLVADVGQDRVRQCVRTDLDAVREHFSRLIPGDGTEFFGWRLWHFHAERQGESPDRLFL